ncbi:MAG: helix-turn-helix domain-containing protein [Oligoflexales bacterium]|nr:helix-turn-helix domain-containing protein [Oligoflexales bacterium]
MNIAIKNNGVIKEASEASKPSTLFDSLITMDELMAILKHQYCRRTIYRWISQGMPYKRIRSRYWFPKDEVILWIERS